MPLGNDNSDLDWDWDDNNFKSNEISFQNDFNKKEDDDLKMAMALSLQEEGKKVFHLSTIYIEIISVNGIQISPNSIICTTDFWC